MASKQYVLFELANQEYALPIDCISSVETRSEISPVPKSPLHVLGVMALRGRLIPIISVRRALGLADTTTVEEQHVLFVRSQEQEFGLCVDRVSGIRQLDHTMISASQAIIEDLNAHYVEGIAQDQDHLVVVLDLEELICAEGVMSIPAD